MRLLVAVENYDTIVPDPDVFVFWLSTDYSKLIGVEFTGYDFTLIAGDILDHKENRHWRDELMEHILPRVR